MADEQSPWTKFSKAASQIADQVAENTRDLTNRAQEALSEVDLTAAADSVSRTASAAAESIRTGEAYRGAQETLSKGVQQIQDAASNLDRESVERSADAVKDAAANASSQVKAAAQSAAASARDAGQKLKLTIQTVTEPLKAAADGADDAELLAQKMQLLLTRANSQLDKNADAIAVGFLGESGAGIAQLRGTELLFVPETGMIRVSEVEGRAFRLALGFAAGTYVQCFYGDTSTLAQPMVRKGMDVDVFVASIGFFRGTNDFGPHVAGWMAALAAAMDIGVPIIGELTAFEITEKVLGKHVLDPGTAATLSHLIQQAPDRSIRRKIAQKLL